MSLLDSVKADVGDVITFFGKLKNDVVKAKSIWVAINSPQTRSFVAALAQHVLTAVKDSEIAVATNGLNIAADAQLLADAKQLIADAKAGDGVIKTDLALLGITL
jgi:hypothetical protein